MWNYETGGGICIVLVITLISIRAIIGTCPEYQCGDGKCYSMTDICDEIGDCSDGGDERECARRKCEEGRFKCANGRCILARHVCDSDDDCRDGSDERNCAQCVAQVFTCKGGGCVNKNEVCDKTRDCLDGSDEGNCTNNGCSWEQFACNNGKCRPGTDRCDGSMDCLDRSDEANCTSCSDGAFKCVQGGCVRLITKCDRRKDCPDGSDEEDCQYEPCETDQFECADGPCISSNFLCDGDVDCLDGSDEANCRSKDCSWDQFVCNNGQCVSPNDRCDRVKDCSDASDEANCTVCPAGRFACRGGGCVRGIWRCDGVPECADGSDEENCGQGNVVFTQSDSKRRKYMDDHVVFYFDSNVPSSITWPFQPVSKAWKYVKETYGSFGPNPLLYVAMHSERNEGSRTVSFEERSHGHRNIIDCGLDTAIPLTIKHSRLFNILITTFGHIIRKGAKDTLNNADEIICGLEMREILSYDVYKYIEDPSEEMDAWVASKRKESNNGIYWFRDWFLPIYEIHGGASVLERFYNLTHKHFPLSTPKMSYSKKLNAGEFVHFWSGAAGTDLQSLARQAINCSEKCEQQILVAQNEYPSLNYIVTNHILGFSKNNLEIYFQTYREYPRSFYEKVLKAWQYFQNKYGPFPHHLTHTIVLNNDTTTTTNSPCKPLQGSPKNENDFFLYIVVCDSASTPKEIVILDEITTHMGSMAMKLRSKTENWWPAFNVSKWTMASIIVYDIYESLENPADAERWLKTKITESFPFPRVNTRWFKNWYSEIYDVHGKSEALIRFLNLLDAQWSTDQFLNTGEFVHFWSGATRTDLQRAAENLLGWSPTYQKELNNARKALPGFNYTWKNDDSDDSDKASDKPKTTPEPSSGSTVGIIVGIFILVLVVIVVIVGLKFYV